MQSTIRPHRRRNPLTGEWILVSPQRTSRPWQGQIEPVTSENRPEYEPTCYLCPGNERSGGELNPDFRDVLVFDNDFPALLPETDQSLTENQIPRTRDDELFTSEPVSGTCRVICFSERHDLSLPRLGKAGIIKVIQTWQQQYAELEDSYRCVQIFENKGELNGCSNPHPHGQVWASNSLPDIWATEDKHQQQYFDKIGSPLLLDYALKEEYVAERLVCSNEDWIVVVPWWATWPFETLLLPKKKVATMSLLDDRQTQNLAAILEEITIRYDNLFRTSFPYSMGWHTAPVGADHACWQLHAHFFPPLLRSASIRKFMVGYEMLAEAQRDLTPESAAAQLRELSSVHYLDQA